MKMRFNIYALPLAMLMIVTGMACTKLKDKPYTTIISTEFNPTKDDIAALVGAGYSQWRFILLDWNGLWRAQEVTADQLVIPKRPWGWFDDGVYQRLHRHTWTTDDDVVNQTWSRTYAGITNCNRIIYQIESGLIPVGDAKPATLAELKVLRASYYAVLCDFYGNVPLVTQFDLPMGYLPKQNTRKEVYDFIVKEITDNIQLLSSANDVTTYGKYNKWAAFTLLAKMYLNAGVYTGTPQWAKCISTCDSVIHSNAYILEAAQKNVFVTENQNSKEIVLAIPMDEDYTNNWNAFDLHMQTLQQENQATYNLKNTPWGGICAIPQFISTFDVADARYQRNWIKGQQYTSSGQMLYVAQGDFAGKPLSFVNELPGLEKGESVHGFRLGKFEIKMGASNRLSNDFPVFRYAEVLMMKAESLLRTGKADEAAAIVTQVRQRDFLNDPARAVVTGTQLKAGSVYAYGMKDQVNNQFTNEGGADIEYGRFLDELGWEFDQEGHRRTDLIRFGVFTKKSWLSHAVTNNNNRILFPIPRTEIQKNGNLTQNPGY
ncbi:RagB/SusD family nutrient uptake outer membrane protein [Chitinophaga polysaccharea]|uniref:RagB/SusD family nutrient uptake outer membrane protein n=1 Tax=Chitinophaga polysaccharea TaxID=1293035 RepID=UPI0014554807|nr:RagB/SusD family nutrient uptake outer membrane protein [Chitinophaga polysaccharea]NLR58651.1 RagB/SusD family nutrient uptake outer membrane protein [Chitinophaga polysaccharea]